MKILPKGAPLLHANGQTNVHNEIVAFRNFSKVPKNVSQVCDMQLTLRDPRMS